MIHRTPNPKRWVSLSPEGLNDVRLSWQAKGLLAYLLSKPDDWEVRLPQLVSASTDGVTTVRTILRELTTYGYATMIYVRNTNNTKADGKRWHVYDSPHNTGGNATLKCRNSEVQEVCTTETLKFRKSEVQEVRSTENLTLPNIKKKPNIEKTPNISFGDFVDHATQSICDEIEIPNAEAFITLYNATVPDGTQKATALSEARRKKIKTYLRQFPRRDFWVTCFRAPASSAFLRGERSSPGHQGFKFTLDWLLTKGKDGTENCVKVYEGHYADPDSISSTPGRKVVL